jgi:DNA-binding transcriptional LysR family regulator
VNVIVLYNTTYTQRALDHLAAADIRVDVSTSSGSPPWAASISRSRGATGSRSPRRYATAAPIARSTRRPQSRLTRFSVRTLHSPWFATAGASFVPRAIAAFRAEQPSVDMIFIEADPDECARRIRDGELDIALIYEFEHGEKAPPDLQIVPLLEDCIYVALPAGHRLAASDEVPLSLLADEAWIQGVRGGSMLEVLPTACLAAGFEPRIAFRTDEHMAVQGLVGAGVGIGLVPELCLPISRRDIVVRPISAPGSCAACPRCCRRVPTGRQP